MGDVEAFGVNNPKVTRSAPSAPSVRSNRIDPIDPHLLVVAEGGGLAEAPGALEGALDPLGAGGVGGGGQVVAQRQVAHALLPQCGGEGGDGGAGFQLPLHAVEAADGLGLHERHGVAHDPRHVQQGLSGFVAGVSPGLAGKARLGEDHGAGGGVGFSGFFGDFRVQPVRCLGPIVGHAPVGVRGGDAPRPAGGGDYDD